MKAGERNIPQGELAPLSIIRIEREDQIQLCNALEAIADQLPAEVDVSLSQKAYGSLRFNLPVYHLNEEALFQRLARNAPSSSDLSLLLEQVKYEHAVHNCYADEVGEFLQDPRPERVVLNSEALGYMLRCCFETMRRHLKWEDLIFMPLAETHTTPGDLRELSQVLVKHRSTLGLSIV